MRKKKVRNHSGYFRIIQDPYPVLLSCLFLRMPTLHPSGNLSSQLLSPVLNSLPMTLTRQAAQSSWNKNAASYHFFFLPHHKYRSSVHKEIHDRHCNQYALRSCSHVPVQNKHRFHPHSPPNNSLNFASTFSQTILNPPFYNTSFVLILFHVIPSVFLSRKSRMHLFRFL